MIQQKAIFFILLLSLCLPSVAQETDDYIEFNDRYNIVHGVYLGWTALYGEIDNENSYFFEIKAAYVANRQFEFGFKGVGFYSEQDDFGLDPTEFDFYGGYGGLHLEPILFKHAMFSLSFPVLIGAGAVGYSSDDFQRALNGQDSDRRNWNSFFIAEPGVNVLYNINRYVQLEAGARYRFSGQLGLLPNSPSHMNGFSIGFGMKVGVFNLGRNRYKNKHQKTGL